MGRAVHHNSGIPGERPRFTGAFLSSVKLTSRLRGREPCACVEGRINPGASWTCKWASVSRVWAVLCLLLGVGVGLGAVVPFPSASVNSVRRSAPKAALARPRAFLTVPSVFSLLERLFGLEPCGCCGCCQLECGRRECAWDDSTGEDNVGRSSCWLPAERAPSARPVGLRLVVAADWCLSLVKLNGDCGSGWDRRPARAARSPDPVDRCRDVPAD